MIEHGAGRATATELDSASAVPAVVTVTRPDSVTERFPAAALQRLLPVLLRPVLLDLVAGRLVFEPVVEAPAGPTRRVRVLLDAPVALLPRFFPQADSDKTRDRGGVPGPVEVLERFDREPVQHVPGHEPVGELVRAPVPGVRPEQPPVRARRADLRVARPLVVDLEPRHDQMRPAARTTPMHSAHSIRVAHLASPSG